MEDFNAREYQLTVDKEQLKELYQLKNYRFVLAVIYEWLIVAASIAICQLYFNPLTYLLALLVIGARMHAMAILMHEASHYRFIRNRSLSDLISNLTLSFPLSFSVQDYRRTHNPHHQFLNTEKDPDWMDVKDLPSFQCPQSKREFITRLLLYIPGVQGIRDLSWTFQRINQHKKPLHMKLQMLGYYAVAAGIITWLGAWKTFALFWIVPLMTTFLLFVYLRSYAEHYGELEYKNLLDGTRTTFPNFLERFFIAPYNIFYHIEHHLYPGVPFYHLPKLHALLCEDPNYKRQAHLTKGYLSGLLQELGKPATN